MAKLNLAPDYSASVNRKPRVNKVMFGDGYESRWKDGLNTNLETWSLNFKCTPADADTLDTFLKDLDGTDSFWWTNPLGQLKAYVCDEHNMSIGEAYNTISAMFREVPEQPLLTPEVL